MLFTSKKMTIGPSFSKKLCSASLIGFNFLYGVLRDNSTSSETSGKANLFDRKYFKVYPKSNGAKRNFQKFITLVQIDFFYLFFS